MSDLFYHNIGSSRGGKNTKIHVLLNERMQAVNVLISGAHIQDSDKALELLAGIDKKSTRRPCLQL